MDYIDCTKSDYSNLGVNPSRFIVKSFTGTGEKNLKLFEENLKNKYGEIRLSESFAGNSLDISKLKSIYFFDEEQAEMRLVSYFENESFETGIANESEYYWRSLYEKNPYSAMDILVKIHNDNFKYTEGIKVNNLVGILHIISHIDFKAPTGLIAHMISSNSLKHPNIEVEEYAIKCYENWDSEVGLDELKKVSFKKKWIQEYADQVIMDIEEEN